MHVCVRVHVLMLCCLLVGRPVSVMQGGYLVLGQPENIVDVSVYKFTASLAIRLMVLWLVIASQRGTQIGIEGIKDILCT